MSMASSSRPQPRPLHLVSNSSSASISASPLSVSAHGPLSAPISLERDKNNEFNTTRTKPNPRRQSSISYNTSSSNLRSPALGRANSLGSKAAVDEAKRCNIRDENTTTRQSQLSSVREAEPVTLTEKHADLLRFIAQKESKCLELRTQLAQHEADLLLLKRKWERIVSKGSPMSVRSDVSAPLGSDMLGGIREGMQTGLEKVLAVLEPSSTLADSASASSIHTTSNPSSNPIRYSQTPTRSSSIFAKRASISTASSGSQPERSSLSGSSASSLFDDISALDRQSVASSSSVEDDSTAYPSSDTEKVLSPLMAQSWPWSPKPSNLSSIHQPDNDNPSSSKHRRSRPTSMNSSQFPSLPSPLSSISSDALTPLSKQMANWVPPGLNKKWEEFKGNETISKQSKRASIILSDMMAVLAPPVPLPRPPSPSTSMKRSKPQSQDMAHAEALAYREMGPTKNANLDVQSDSVRTTTSPSPSLLDDDDECSTGEVLQPQVMAPVLKQINEGSSKGEEDEEDEWNW